MSSKNCCFEVRLTRLIYKGSKVILNDNFFPIINSLMCESAILRVSLLAKLALEFAFGARKEEEKAQN